jgi:hypothetical protein
MLATVAALAVVTFVVTPLVSLYLYDPQHVLY